MSRLWCMWHVCDGYMCNDWDRNLVGYGVLFFLVAFLASITV